MTKALAVIVGVGPGTGAAISRAFSKRGYAVALLARSKGKTEALSKTIEEQGGMAEAFECDVSSEDSVKNAFKAIKGRFTETPLRVAVFNASSPFLKKPFLDTTSNELQDSLSANIQGGFHFSQAALHELLSHSEGGSLIFTGATASLRGGSELGAFATGKFGLRALSQSLAREFGPQGIHVAHVIVDGLIDTARVSEQLGPAAVSESRLSPDSIAAAYVYLHEQDRSCWTQELDLRPSLEKF